MMLTIVKTLYVLKIPYTNQQLTPLRKIGTSMSFLSVQLQIINDHINPLSADPTK